MKPKQTNPLRKARRAGWLALLGLLILVGAAVGWHFWQVDAARVAGQRITFNQLLIDGSLIGAAVVIGSVLLFWLPMRAMRRSRSDLEAIAERLKNNPASEIEPPSDPALATLVATLTEARASATERPQPAKTAPAVPVQQRHEEQAVFAAARTLGRTLELEPLLSEFCHSVAAHFKLRYVAVALLSDQGLTVRHGALRHNDDTIEPLPPTHLPEQGGLAGEALQTRQLVVRRQPPFDSLLRAPGQAAFQMAQPLFNGTQLNGVLLFHHDEPVSDERLQRLQLVGEYLDAALINAQQYSAARERATNLTAINELARLISSSLDIKQVLSTALQQIRQLVPYDQASVTLFDSDHNHFEVVAATDAIEGSLSAGQTFSGQGTPLQTAFEAGHPVSLTHLHQSDMMKMLEPLDPDTQSLLVLPLVTSAVRLGTLNLACRAAAAFDDGHIALLAGLSHFLTTALANARLYFQRSQALQQIEDTQNHLLFVEKLRALGELAGGVTHDFNNLLAGIIGNVQLLLEESEDPEQRSTLQLIEKAAKDGAETVKRIQGFARQDADQPDAPVDMSALAQDAIDLTRLRWRNASQEMGILIDLQREIHAVPIIRGHAPELREVLTNLIINAVDAMPDGGTLRVATGQRGAEVFVSVADTGVGMSDEIRARIFNPFFTTKGDKGNGLGLAVSAAIVQRHGGRIEVQSKIGRGTNFVVWLPILEVNLTDVSAHDDDIPQIQGRILVVEDEELVRVALSRMFAAWGHRVVAAADGRSAIQEFKPGGFDVVICDLGLPDMTGWDVLRDIRDRDSNVHTLLLSGWARQIDPAEARLRGAELVMSKPFDQLTLRRTIAHLMEGTLDMTPRIIA